MSVIEKGGRGKKSVIVRETEKRHDRGQEQIGKEKSNAGEDSAKYAVTVAILIYT